ncbi:FMN-dependent alpha-hydroxy acid dehydrogenase ASCRUDRAFT_36853 [Ascoidea rubescens DSM 1968]|uniref:L-lactate dehydrogenase (cytochrome) n=1 Tax=Ascoidea rubescens DSM 1968 TaxID=1344418 RepID=A0A1D2VE51_9ASCO|nr:hypothetical protein ASCRUDRAFT_36853 [Ascoidea rubescens DSM 1968]ODV59906.1 hypothetical protein ASCRUDRAFT_36853 [Ascoidea rubescens DSM 1968]
MSKISSEELAKHTSEKDCWLAIHGKVYDMTTFLEEHPGGSKILLKYAGKDATKPFDQIHSTSIIDFFEDDDNTMGTFDAPPPSTKSASQDDEDDEDNEGDGDEEGDDEDEEDDDEDADGKEKSSDSSNTDKNVVIMRNNELKPTLDQIFSLNDFEYVARYSMPVPAWAYYSSGGDDEITYRENHLAYQRIFFKPRILINVLDINLSTTLLGSKTSAPFYISATALAKLGHPDGEKCLTRACGKENIIQMVSTMSSYSFEDIMNTSLPDQDLWFQLYVNSNRKICEKIIKKVEKLGYKSIFVTVDNAHPGNREKDKRNKSFVISNLSLQSTSQSSNTMIDPRLCWDDIKWIQSITKLPIVIKGVGTVEDAVKAIDYNVQGIVLSNHGGRELEFARPPIEVLAELNPILKQKNLKGKFDVYIDGGVRRGTDIIKALCLGAKAVGIGRSFLYALSTYGDDGVEKAIKILKDELLMNMRLLGVTSLDQLNDRYIDIKGLESRSFVGFDNFIERIYEPMALPKYKSKL